MPEKNISARLPGLVSSYTASRITRATLKLETPESLTSSMTIKKSGQKKKVKFEKVSTIEGNSYKNVSLASDEGIDMNYFPSMSSLSIPSSIIKLQHPLAHSWSFWYSAGDKKLSWKQNQIKISTVATIEEFWHTYTQMQPASCLPAGNTVSVFRVGIVPDWEDRHNKDGGRWMMGFTKTERQEKLDSRWMEVLIMLMGEHAEEQGPKMITGAEVCVRKKEDRLEVWLGDVDNMRGVVEVGRKLKRKLGLGSSTKIQFTIHEEERGGVVGSSLML